MEELEKERTAVASRVEAVKEGLAAALLAVSERLGSSELAELYRRPEMESSLKAS